MKFIDKLIKEKNDTESKNIVKIIKGSTVAIIITLLGLLIYSVILASTEIGENTINYVVIGISALSILIGSIIRVSKIDKNGMLNGAIVGGIYIVIIYLLSSIINLNFDINSNSIILIFFSMVAGMLGGVIGVNIKK